jgi:hypothetical protein
MSKFGDFKNIRNACYAFMFAGIFITFITILIAISNGVYTNNLLIGTISGYSTIIIGVAGLMCLFMMSVNYQDIANTIGTLYDNIAIIVQFILILVILGYSFFLNGTYFDKIIENRVNESYKWFLFISILLLFVQFIILVNLINTIYNKSNINTKNMLSTNVQIIISLFVALLNMTALITSTQSLVFFSTDG